MSPRIVYSEDHPISDTAVLVAFQPKESSVIGVIRSVDSKSFNRWVGNFPSYVRVLPGDHSFELGFNTVQGLVLYYAKPTVTVKNMQPRHIYSVNFQMNGTESVSAIVEDLGEKPDYSVINFLGKSYPVEF